MRPNGAAEMTALFSSRAMPCRLDDAPSTAFLKARCPSEVVGGFFGPNWPLLKKRARVPQRRPRGCSAFHCRSPRSPLSFARAFALKEPEFRKRQPVSPSEEARSFPSIPRQSSVPSASVQNSNAHGSEVEPFRGRRNFMPEGGAPLLSSLSLNISQFGSAFARRIRHRRQSFLCLHVGQSLLADRA